MAPDRPDAAAADAADVRLAARNDPHAFERLYRRHVARIHTLVSRMIGAELADEVTQDVFVRAWEKLGTFRGDAAFGTWLHRVAINLVLGRRKALATRRERMHPGGDDLVTAHPARPVRADLSVEFEAGLRSLPDGAREVFVLHDVEGFKHAEIARMLGVTVGTTKAQLHRARMRLRRFVTE